MLYGSRAFAPSVQSRVSIFNWLSADLQGWILWTGTALVDALKTGELCMKCLIAGRLQP
jgi:hypothetical protein